MIAVKDTDLCKNINSYMDKLIENNETILVVRENNKNIVVLSEENYNNLIHIVTI